MLCSVYVKKILTIFIYSISLVSIDRF